MKANRIFSAILLLFPLLSNAQAFVNGSFETNTAPGSVFNVNNATFNTYMNGAFAFGGAGAMDIQNGASAFAPAQNGNWFVSLEYLVSGDAFTMRLSSPLTSGSTYYICYWDKGVDNGAGCCPPSAALQIGISTVPGAPGTIVYTSPAPTLGVWTQRVFSFVAPNNGQYVSVNMTAWRWTLVDNFVLSLSNTCNPILGHSLEAFSGENLGPALNRLHWTTSVGEASRFTIERAGADMQFAPIGSLIGTQPLGGSYSFDDLTFTEALNHYRLRLLHSDGSETFSEIVTLQAQPLAASSFAIVPNPNPGRFHLQFELPLDENAEGTIEIVNLSGQKVFAATAPLAWLRREEFQLDLPRGAYIALLRAGESMQSAKFILY